MFPDSEMKIVVDILLDDVLDGHDYKKLPFILKQLKNVFTNSKEQDHSCQQARPKT